MNNSQAEACARGHLASMLELHAVGAPLSIALRNKVLVDECYWFGFHFPDECWIGASWVIGVRKADGSLAHFGTDGSE